ncbi:DUF58 domain-containing protein [Desulfobacula toluolica]|uniref:Conserved uncharacterized protein, DUF583 n=1 Tax=Desulfobacula toluolica (strain DSM 7467 / Tol2) TaxID=651182 RepID=K0NFK1_DESTT|nr:DUF58 domain-containing protein [Desulfobacula toluolica]CCK79705.1 conserved uncharacterized protein, DUF583 [Desulfobacula toluolica Tol2]
MIPAHIIKKIKRIHIKSSRTVNSIMAGQYKSVFRGSGIEFEEVREYCPGDDVKTIDWKVSARLGKPFVKLYKEERESIVMLLIDMSASLKFGTFFGPKLERAAEVASVLAFNAVKNNDKVGVIFFTDRVEKYIPPKKGSGHIWRVIKEIFTFSPQGKGTDISEALDFLAKISKKRSFVFVLSDFLDDGYLKSLRTVRQRHEVIGVMIYDQGAFELPFKGIVTLSDFETDGEMVFDAFDTHTRKKFFTAKQANHKKTLTLFSKAQSDVIELETAASVSDTLSRYFRLRERRLL